MPKRPELTKKQMRAAELAGRAEARKAKPVPVVFGEGGEGLLFPTSLPCNYCGKPVEGPRKNLMTVVEKEEGNPLWLALHPECAARYQP